jgi:heparanase 1
LEYFRVNVIFGLNALAGRSVHGGVAVGPWNPTNAESFIRYTVSKKYNIHGWEFGNELCGAGIGTSVAAGQYASDVVVLRKIVQDVYRGVEPKPLIIAPGGFFDGAANWFKEFLNKSDESANAVTHHIYNLGPGMFQKTRIKISYVFFLISVNPFITESYLLTHRK